MLKLISTATAAALFAMANASMAQSASPSSGPHAPSFSAVDTNNDGQISRAEWDAHFGAGAGAAGATGGEPLRRPPGMSGAGSSTGVTTVPPKIDDAEKRGDASSGATGAAGGGTLHRPAGSDAASGSSTGELTAPPAQGDPRK